MAEKKFKMVDLLRFIAIYCGTDYSPILKVVTFLQARGRSSKFVW